MASAKEYEQRIKRMRFDGLRRLWHNRNNDGSWESGKALEYIIIRAFELEIQKAKSTAFNSVSYPFDVPYPFPYGEKDTKKTMEQIDGAIHIDGMHALIECKDYSDSKIDVGPLSKLRNQLARRHGVVFGLFFSTSGYTEPAQIQVSNMAPQIILLWDKEDIEFCLSEGCFIECLKEKYRQAIENCEYYYDYKLSITGVNKFLVTR